MIQHITPNEAFSKMTEEGYHYLDVRTAKEFANGHPKGAVNIPVFLATPEGRQLNENFIALVRQSFPVSAKLVVGCQSGGRSATACEILAKQGYLQILNVAGSFGGGVHPETGELVKGWQAEKLPVE